ncbi:MAG: YfhO family protein [Oscillospiraceae bacterium]|nr:YfhO family protein [Oscillospiraceae bacterium]
MKCTLCGAELEENATFCPFCGSTFAPAEPADIDVPLQPDSIEPVIPVPTAEPITLDSPKLKFPAGPLILAFLIPFLGMLAIMFLGKYEPFGDTKAILYSDEYHQYYPFFVEFRRALLSGDSLLFNWSVGMGMDYLGLISYYLSSPLNLLCVLVPESMTLELFAILMPVRLGLAGLFFALFLKKLFRVNDYSISIFGAFYGLCAWALAYQWNVMWLDTFALLPLVALGTVSLLRDKKFILYTIALFLSVFANYYIGFFTCIFILLLFICYEICRFPGIKRFALDLGRIALFSILAIGMTAVLELPALAALQNTQSSVNLFPEDFALNIVSADLCASAKEAWEVYKTAKADGAGLLTLMGHWLNAFFESFPPILEGMRQVAGNTGAGLVPTFKEGLPNLYCGVGSIALAFLFLTAKGVKLRDKLCSLGLLLLFMLSFILRQLDYIWHGFHFTNMIPYRFSFLFSFVMLYMAYRAWLIRDRFELWQLIIAAAFSFFIMSCSNEITDLVFVVFNTIFLVLYLGILAFIAVEKGLSGEHAVRDSRRRRQSAIILSVIMSLELLLNLANFATEFPATTVTNYPMGTEDSASAIRYMQEREKFSDFYRAETTHSQTLNDGAINGYNGISTFTSSANVRITEFMRALGYGAKNTYNRYCFEEASPVANLFLNLKYMLEREGNVEDNAYFDTVYSSGNTVLLENNAYLPLGFLAEPSLEEATLEKIDGGENYNSFMKQNILFKLATGLEQNVWNFLDSNTLTISGSKSLTIVSKYTSGWTKYSTGSNAATLRYTYTMKDAGLLCLDLNLYKRNSFTVYKNNEKLFKETMSLRQTLAICQVEPGDVVYLDIVCNSNTTNGVVDIRPALLNDEVFRQGYDILNASTLDITDFSNTRIEGTIDCNRDGLMYTSIPYDGNWVAEVDGEEVEAVLVGDCMMALKLTKGQHNVIFRYKNSAYTIGLLVSISCLVVFLGCIFVPVIIQKSKRKKQQ